MTSYLRVTRASGLWWVGHAAIHASYHFLQQLPCPEIALCKARIMVCQIISWKHYSMMARAPSRWSDRPVKRIDAAEVRVTGGTCDQSSDWRSCGMRGIQEGCLPAGEGGGEPAERATLDSALGVQCEFGFVRIPARLSPAGSLGKLFGRRQAGLGAQHMNADACRITTCSSLSYRLLGLLWSTL